jgi:hypothetical protein
VDGFQPYKSNSLHTMVAFMVAPLTVRTEDRWVLCVAHTVGLVPGSNSAELRVSELPFFQAVIQEMLLTAHEGIQVMVQVATTTHSHSLQQQCLTHLQQRPQNAVAYV